MFAVMRDTEYMQKQTFKDNFWNDWRKLLGKNHVIQNLKDCDFTPIYDWYQIEKEKKKQISSEVSCFMLFHLNENLKGSFALLSRYCICFRYHAQICWFDIKF